MLKLKNKFFDIFKLEFSWVESNGDKLSCLQTDNVEKFISLVLKNFCNEKEIDIKYITPYMFKENSIVKQF